MPERRKGPRWVKIILFLAFLASVPLAVWAIVELPRRPVARWVVDAEGLDAASLRAAAVSAAGGSFMAADAALIRAAVLSDPEVAQASVRKAFPETIVVRARPRRAVAVVLLEASGGESRAGLLDSTGCLFRIGPAAAVSGLPVISGLMFVDPHPGLEIKDRRITAITSSLGDLERSGTGLLGMVSEISVVNGDSGGLELLVYATSRSVRFRAMPELDEATLKTAALVLDVINRQGMAAGVSELDLRTGTVVYRTKEEML